MSALRVKLGELTSRSMSGQLLSPVKLRLSIPEGFEAFNGSPCVKPWSILQLIEETRHLSFRPLEGGQSFVDFGRFSWDYTGFIIGAKTDVAREMYDPSSVKGPLSVDIEMVHLGRKSFHLQTTAFLKGLESPLFTNNVQYVVISNKTKRPAEMPAWYQEKRRKYFDESRPPVRVPPIEASHPPLANDYSVAVPLSEVDKREHHMHWIKGVENCYDAYMSHYLQNNTVDGLKRDRELMRNVKSFSQSYVKEIHPWDVLNVHMWQHKVNEKLYQFKVLKKPVWYYVTRKLLPQDSLKAMECSIEFYPQNY